MAKKKSGGKQPQITIYELVGGPFCGVRINCVMPPELVLLLNGPSLHGLIAAELEERYLRRKVQYDRVGIRGTRAVYVCKGFFVEVGNVQT